ncbi:hypothetical protein [Desulfolucanica intricata]|uniref:hypothetical protein n=1 Tax=Desulfolucanica intricata TaxID=1285191 RepID=UPI00082C3A58|nr:hypothetical protein [Desulfolucanica intricata]
MRRGFLNWGYRLEGLFIKIIICAAVLVVVSQTFLMDDPLKRVTSQVGFPQDTLQNQNILVEPNAPIITMQLKNYSSLPRARVLVNGEQQKEFLDRYVTVSVKHGDVIEIDGTQYKHSLEIEVINTSREILSPCPGQIIKVNGNLARVGTVKLVK